MRTRILRTAGAVAISAGLLFGIGASAANAGDGFGPKNLEAGKGQILEAPQLDPSKLPPINPDKVPPIKNPDKVPPVINPDKVPPVIDPGKGDGKPPVIVDCYDPAKGHMVPCEDLPDPKDPETPEHHEPEYEPEHHDRVVYHYAAPVVRVSPTFTG